MMSETDVLCLWFTLHLLGGALWWIVFLLSFAVMFLLYRRTRVRFLVFFLAGYVVLLISALPNAIYPQGNERPIPIGALIESMRFVYSLLCIIGGLACIRWFIRTGAPGRAESQEHKFSIRTIVTKWIPLAIVGFMIAGTGWYFWPEVRVSLLELPAYEPDVLSKFGLQAFPRPPPNEANSLGYNASSRSLGFCRQLTLGFDPSRAKIVDGTNCISYVTSADIRYYSTKDSSSKASHTIGAEAATQPER